VSEISLIPHSFSDNGKASYVTRESPDLNEKTALAQSRLLVSLVEAWSQMGTPHFHALTESALLVDVR
jgi:hypothetical protein